MTKPFPILIADDDPEDRMLIQDAIEECGIPNPVHCVEDGEELLDFLRRRGAYAGTAAPRPGLILLDLNMPRKDGREVLAELKSDPALRRIPVIVLTTSKEEEDILRTYDLGVNSFITKPPSFDELVVIMNRVRTYWIELVRLPESDIAA